METGKVIGKIKSEKTIALMQKCKCYEGMVKVLIMEHKEYHERLWKEIGRELNLSDEFIASHKLSIAPDGVVQYDDDSNNIETMLNEALIEGLKAMEKAPKGDAKCKAPAKAVDAEEKMNMMYDWLNQAQGG